MDGLQTDTFISLHIVLPYNHSLVQYKGTTLNIWTAEKTKLMTASCAMWSLQDDNPLRC